MRQEPLRVGRHVRVLGVDGVLQLQHRHGTEISDHDLEAARYHLHCELHLVGCESHARRRRRGERRLLGVDIVRCGGRCSGSTTAAVRRDVLGRLGFRELHLAGAGAWGWGWGWGWSLRLSDEWHDDRG